MSQSNSSTKPPLGSGPTQRFTNVGGRGDGGNNHEEKKMSDSAKIINNEGNSHHSILRKKKGEGADAHPHHNEIKVSFSDPSRPSRPSNNNDDIPPVMSDVSEGSMTGPSEWKHQQMDDSKTYNLKDLLESTKEGHDEAAVLSLLERSLPLKEQKNSVGITQDNMLPRVPDELLLNLQKEVSDRREEEGSRQDDEDSNDPNLAQSPHKEIIHGDSDDLRSLTRRLAGMPLVGGKGVDGNDPSRLQLLRHRSSATQSDASRISSKDANNNGGNDDSDDGTNDSVKLSRAGVDRYYNNAALIFPTKRTRSGSIRVSDPDVDIESAEMEGRSHDDEEDDPSSKKKKKKQMSVLQRIREARRRAKVDFDFFVEFMEPHKRTIWKTFWQVTWFVMVPSLVLSGILFYAFDNPPTGYALIPCSNPTETIPNNPFPYLSERFDITPVPSPAPTLAPAVVNASYVPTISEAPAIQPTKQPTYSVFDNQVPLCIDEERSLEAASISWWFLFLGCRQVVLLCVAIFLQLLVIDFLTLRTRLFPKLLGTQISLAIAQSKGWPFVLLMWALLDLIFLYGSRRVARHWLFWQKWIQMMNATNPSGNITDSDTYKLIIYISIGLGAAVTVKRTLMGNFVGKRVVVNYREDLSKIIKKCLLISEVAALATLPHRLSERKTIVQRFDSFGKMYVKPLGRKSSSDDESEGDGGPSIMASEFMNVSPFGRSGNGRISSLTGSFEAELAEMLDEWEEPELGQENSHTVKTTDVLYFRRALGFVDNAFPFSPAFGRANTREECVQSSQKIFEKLQTGRRHVLNFKSLCEITKSDDGTSDKMKIRDLIKLFRPNRLGEISKMEFVMSVDSVYKQLRLLLANIRNSSQIDNAYERIINSIFSVIAGFIVLAAFGLDINSIFVLLSSILVSFAFMIGSASSKYLEGILLILVRKPYDIGDRVAFLDPNSPVDTKGPPAGGWVVERVDLYTTTVRLGTTREYATFTNGSLANSRIVNMKRSDKPNIFMNLKFTINVTKEQLEAFKMEMTKYIKDRPREWIRINGFRCTRVETELQYLEYVLIVQHRESWQSFSTIQDSQGDVFIHALHLQKEMGMEYIAPKVPIEMLNGGQLARLPFQDGSQTRTANVNTASEDLAKNKIV